MTIDPDGNVLEQYEVYDDGPTLHYDTTHLGDEFGGLSEALDDAAIRTALDEFAGEFIDEDVYRQAVSEFRPTNG